MTKPKLVIVAGVNGAGKSTFFETNKKFFDNTKRLNADEILIKNGGNWRKNSDIFRAMKIEYNLIKEYLENKESFHIETTLAGSGKTVSSMIDEAHKKGYEVSLLYITLDSYEKAVDRVNSRVEKGGHGVPKETIIKRYYSSLNNLNEIALKADNVIINNNSQKMETIYRKEKGIIIKDELKNYEWINSMKNNKINIDMSLLSGKEKSFYKACYFEKSHYEDIYLNEHKKIIFCPDTESPDSNLQLFTTFEALYDYKNISKLLFEDFSDLRAEDIIDTLGKETLEIVCEKDLQLKNKYLDSIKDLDLDNDGTPDRIDSDKNRNSVQTQSDLSTVGNRTSKEILEIDDDMER